MMRIFVTHSGSRTGQTKASVMRSTLLGRRTRNRQKEEDEPGHAHDGANRGRHDAEDPGCPRKGPIARGQPGRFEPAGGGPAHEVGDGPADQAGNAERDPKDQSDDGHSSAMRARLSNGCAAPCWGGGYAGGGWYGATGGGGWTGRRTLISGAIGRSRPAGSGLYPH